MARAPNSGAPRVSAHVVPKGPAAFPKRDVFEGNDENEQTALESGWEDESSTTIAEQEAAEKVRALGTDRPDLRPPKAVSTTNMLDEPTVDDGRIGGAPAPALGPSTSRARLLITGGNDKGKSLQIQPGKTFTVGRGIDNDLVLTDIAVSRKHFDLKHEGGAWVLIDRRSGNGTVVNGAIEDNAFVLANGDTIEIGNTTFRFEMPNGLPRAHPSAARETPSTVSLDASMDGALEDVRGKRPPPDEEDEDDNDDEMSTVAQPLQDPPSQPPPSQRARPATQGPPPVPGDAPMPQTVQRPRPVTQGPPPSPAPAPRARAATQAPPVPRDAPMPQTTIRPRPATQGPPMAAPMPAPMPSPSLPAPQPAPYAAPNPVPAFASTLPLPSRPLGPQQPTILGDPMGMQQMPPQAMGPGPALYNNGYPMLPGAPGASGAQPAMAGYNDYGRGMPPAYGTQRPPRISRRTLLLIGAAGLAVTAAVLTVVIIQAAAGSDSSSNKTPTPAKVDEKPVATAPAPAPTKPTVEPIKPPTVTPIAPAPSISPKGEPPKPEPAVATTPEPKGEPPKPEPPKPEPPKPEPKTKVATTDSSAAARKREEAAAAAAAKKEREEQAKRDREEAAAKKREEAAAKKDKTRVAADSGGVKDKAEALYRAKNFTGAANALKAAAKGDDATELKSLAAVYENFGKAYNVGMAPGTAPKQAFDLLTKAKNYDNRAGNAFTSEINSKLADIAPKAAVAFMADKDYVRAKNAVAIAEAAGKGNSTTQGVKSSLETAAGKLFKEAQAELDTDEKSARDKLKQVQQMVPASSQWNQKAGKLLAGG